MRVRLQIAKYINDVMLFLVAADLELICWLKVETFLNDLMHIW